MKTVIRFQPRGVGTAGQPVLGRFQSIGTTTPLAAIGARHRRRRWDWNARYRWWGLDLRPGWVMYVGPPWRWTRAELDAVKERAAARAAALAELVEEP